MRDQLLNIHWTIEKAKKFQKKIYFCFIDYAKAFDSVSQNKLWKILKEMEIQEHLTWLPRSLYAGQEATVRTGHGTTDWFKIGKGVCQGCIHHSAYLTYMQSTSGEGNGNPLQNSSPDNPMEGVAWWAAVHGVTKSQKRQKRLNISSKVHHEKCWAG